MWSVRLDRLVTADQGTRNWVRRQSTPHTALLTVTISMWSVRLDGLVTADQGTRNWVRRQPTPHTALLSVTISMRSVRVDGLVTADQGTRNWVRCQLTSHRTLLVCHAMCVQWEHKLCKRSGSTSKLVVYILDVSWVFFLQSVWCFIIIILYVFDRFAWTSLGCVWTSCSCTSSCRPTLIGQTFCTTTKPNGYEAVVCFTSISLLSTWHWVRHIVEKYKIKENTFYYS